MDEAERKAIEKIAKLMKLGAAGSGASEAEAASALKRAQEMMLAYNLDMAVIEQASGSSGKRLDEMVSGGMHKYQRSLWDNIAKLNFCLYWTHVTAVKEGSAQAKRGRKRTHEHRIVGRVVNVASTKNMAFYLDQTIERMCRERLGGDHAKQYYSSDAVAYREGIADRVIGKIVKRRHQIEEQEEEKEAEDARRASKAGVSLATTLTVRKLSESEREANDDFLYGAGYTARRKAARAEAEARWAETRAEQAKANAEAERVFSQWAAAHPKEAAEMAAKERAKERSEEKRRERRATNGGGRYRFRETKEDLRRGSGAYHAGYEAGAKVSIEPQMKNGDQKRIGQ